jgi:hypothetical protein
LASRGIVDLGGEELDVLVAAVNTSPTRAAFGALRKQRSSIGGLWAEAKKHATPGWTNAPAAIPRFEWRDDQQVHRVIVKLDAAAEATVARLFSEIPMAGGSEDDEPACRGFDGWVTVEGSERANGTLSVHVGKHTIEVLGTHDSHVVREILLEENLKSMRFDAAASGDDPATGWITLGLPDRR